jgi:hypothetical protein
MVPGFTSFDQKPFDRQTFGQLMPYKNNCPPKTGHGSVDHAICWSNNCRSMFFDQMMCTYITSFEQNHLTDKHLVNSCCIKKMSGKWQVVDVLAKHFVGQVIVDQMFFDQTMWTQVTSFERKTTWLTDIWSTKQDLIHQKTGLYVLTKQFVN